MKCTPPKLLALTLCCLGLSTPQLYSAGTLEVRAPGYDYRSAEYTTSHVFIDEVAGTSADIEVLFDLTGFNNITDVEVFTNLNRRHLATTDKNADGYHDGVQSVDGNTISDSAGDTDPTTGHYYIPLNMTDGDSNKIYELNIPATKTGAYRLAARFKTSDSIAENGFDPNAWIWYGLRDHAIVVSPIDARDVRLYEINVFNIDAGGDTFAQRSTFEDLHDAPGAAQGGNGNWNLDYLKSLGMNWLWFQPIHPNGIDGREPSDGWGGSASPYDPGSPYAVKNFFEVNELMTVNYNGGNTTAQNRTASMTAFQNFVTAADAEQVGVMLDAPFNHTAFDVELAQQGVDLFQRDGETWSTTDEIRNRDARFFSRDYNPSVVGAADPFVDGGENYADRATSASDIAPGPDRFDFGKWNDVKDVFFGRYDALVEYNDFNGTATEGNSYKNEGDTFYWNEPDWTALDFTQGGEQWNLTRRVWQYFGEYAVHWLEKTRPAGQNRNSTAGDGDATTRYAWDKSGIDGVRCDFGQGLPPRCWEYIINRARSYKWNFVMMSESLDGGAVTYRSNRHFDILNENISFPLKSATDKAGFRAIFDDRRSAYGQGLVLMNNTSHDEEVLSDPWESVVRSAACGMMDGTTMIFPGQELGISTTIGYQHYETNFGKQIAHFKRWNSMLPIWSDTDYGNDQLYPVYSGIQTARGNSPALTSSNRWFLDGDGDNTRIFAAAKYEQANASPAVKDVVLAFANVDRDNDQSDNFKIPAALAPLLGLQDGRTYNARNLAAYIAQDATRRDQWLWGGGLTGAALKSTGFTVFMKKVPTDVAGWSTAPYEAQYLKVYDITAPVATPGLPEKPNVYAYEIGTSVHFDWEDVVADAGGVVPHYAVTVTVNGSETGTFLTAVSEFTVEATDGDTVSISVKAVNPDYTGNAGPASPASATVSLLAAGDDEDGDGVSNADEDSAGTDPLDPTSYFAVKSLNRTGNTVTVRWDSVVGIDYVVQARPELATGSWQDIDGSQTTGTGGEVSAAHSVLATDPRMFYRVRTDP